MTAFTKTLAQRGMLGAACSILWQADMNAKFSNTQVIFKDVHPPMEITLSVLENRK